MNGLLSSLCPTPFSSCYHSGFLGISSHLRTSFLFCFFNIFIELLCFANLTSPGPSPPSPFPLWLSDLLVQCQALLAASGLHQENLPQSSSSMPMAFSELLLSSHFTVGETVPLLLGWYIMSQVSQGLAKGEIPCPVVEGCCLAKRTGRHSD